VSARRRLQWLGVAAVAAGLAVALSGVPLPALRAREALAVLGAGAASLGVGYAYDRWLSEADRWTPPTPERGLRVPVPGDAVAGLPERRVVERLRRRAVAVLVRGDRSREEAEASVADGTWTGDAVAAAYLGEDLRLPLVTRLRWLVAPDSTAERVRERTVAAIRRRRGEGSP
jgi:hypothetical protein